MSLETGSSASVKLRLVVDDGELPLSHVGPNEFVVRGSCEPVEPGHAVLKIVVDRELTEKKVFLPFGVPQAGVRVKYF